MGPLWLLMLVALPAQADLYRWIDPATGAVKISTLPPADTTIEAEVVRYNAPPTPKPAPVIPLAKPPAASVLELEGRWRALLTQLTGVSPQDFKQGSEGLRQQIEAYEAVRAELDRQDPAGAARRGAESTTLLERLKQGLAAQVPPPPRR